MKPTYVFRLKKDDSTYYGLVAGVVGTSSSPVNLESTVVDWKSFQIRYTRHEKYHGVFRSYSPDTIRFANDGAKILRYVFNTQGASEAICYFEILRLKTSTQTYETLVNCAIDFSQYKNSVHYVDVHLMEGGLSALLNAYDTTEYPIPLTSPGLDPDSTYLWVDGLLFKGTVNYETQARGLSVLSINTPGADYNTSPFGMPFIGYEGEYAAIVGQTVICDPTGTITALAGTFDEKWAYNILKAGTYEFTIDPLPLNMQWGATNPDGVKVEIWAEAFSSASFGASLGPAYRLQLYSNTGSYQSAGTILSETVPAMFYSRTLPAGSFVIIYFRIKANSPHAGGPYPNRVLIDMPTSPVKARVKYDYIPIPHPCRSISHSNLFKKLFHKLTSSTAVDPISDLLVIPSDTTAEQMQIIPKNTYFTCGDGLRRLYYDANLNLVDPIIKMTIADFHDDAYLSIGGSMGIEKDSSNNEVLRMERLEHFYQKDVLIKNLGSKITEWKMYPYTKYLGNNYKIGSKDQNYTDINGRYEFNSLINTKSPIIRTQNDIDLTGPFRDDPYGIIYTQINFANKETSDTESDNDVFKIQSDGHVLSGIESVGLTPDPVRLDRTHTITAGLPADIAAMIFNVAFTPQRKLYHLKSWMKSWFHGIIAPKLTFLTATKNSKLVSQLGLNPPITEEGDIDLSGDDTELIFKPWVFDFKAQIPLDLLSLMAANPYGAFGHEVYRRGKKHYLEGFVLDIGINDATKEIYNVKLLCSPNTDIEDLL